MFLVELFKSGFGRPVSERSELIGVNLSDKKRLFWSPKPTYNGFDFQHYVSNKILIGTVNI